MAMAMTMADGAAEEDPEQQQQQQQQQQQHHCTCPHHPHSKPARLKKQEALAIEQITKLTSTIPAALQRGGQGNVHKDDDVPVHEGLADKLKNKIFPKKK